MLLDGNICEKNKFPEKLCIPEFYSECITCFNMCKCRKETPEVHSVLTEPIWCNDIVVCKGKSLLYKNWIDSGYIYIKDLYKDGQFVTSQHVVNTLCEKRNWIVEYKQIRDAINRVTRKMTDIPQYAMYVNVKNIVRFCSHLEHMC